MQVDRMRTTRIFIKQNDNYEFVMLITDPETVKLVKVAVPERFDRDGDVVLENEFELDSLEQKIKTGRKL